MKPLNTLFFSCWLSNKPSVFYLAAVLLLLSFRSPAQFLQRSTLGMGGSVNTFTAGNKAYLVSQSVGQASVIGTFRQAAYAVGQGYQQAPGQILVRPVSKALDVAIYPNPVSTYITIQLRENVQTAIRVALIDITGTLVYQETQATAATFAVDMSPLAPGVYLLRLTTGRKSFAARIIKN